jgi:hypothetical protein
VGRAPRTSASVDRCIGGSYAGPKQGSAMKNFRVRCFCSCPVFVAHHLSASGSMA